MKARLRLFISLLFCTLWIQAQNNGIKGIVSDESQQPIENVTLRLFQDSLFVKGGTTDLKGKFQFTALEKGDYKIILSCIGYRTQEIWIKDVRKTQDIGTIYLPVEEEKLSEVVVEGKSMVRKTDRMLVYPSSESKKYSNDGYMLLNRLMLPKIDVDLLSNSVTMLGQAVTLCINGREVTMNEIKTLRPKEVARIEYHDYPTGEFAGKKAVIDYIIIPRDRGGYIGVNAEQQQTYGNYILTGKLYHKKSEFTLMYNPHYQTNEDVYSNKHEIFSGKDKELNRWEEGIPSESKVHSQAVMGGYNRLTPKSQLNINAGYLFYETPQSEYSAWRTSDNTDKSIKINRNTESRSSTPYANLFYHLTWGKGNTLRLTGDFSHNHNNYDRHYSETIKDSGSQPYTLHNGATENFNQWKGSAAYTKSFKNQGKLYSNVNHIQKNTDVEYRGNNADRENLRQSETLVTIGYNQMVGKWYLNAAMGIDYLTYKQNDNDRKTFFSARPTLSANYNINQSTGLHYSVYMGNNYPEMFLVSGTQQRIDSLLAFRGNPELDNVKFLTQNLDFWGMLWKGYISFNFTHRTSFHNIIETYLLEDNTYVRTFLSTGDSHWMNGSLSYTRNLGNHIRLKLTGGWERRINTGKGANQHSDWYANLNAVYFHKAFSFSAYGSTPRSILDPDLSYSHNSASLNLYASYTKNDFSFSIGYYNPWNVHNRYSLQSGYYNVRSESFRKSNDHLVYARLSWNISFGQKHKYTQSSISKERNSAIIKAE